MSSAPLVDLCRLHAAYCAGAGSPFYGTLLEQLAVAVEDGRGPVADLLADRGDSSFDDAVPLRFLYALHRLALSGASPALAARFPTTDGDGDGRAAWPAVEEAVIAHEAEIRQGLAHPPQTNEVGRSAALVGAFLEVTAAFGRPLRLLEVGSSAGLNLLVDRYWYAPGEGEPGVGDPSSRVRFVDWWQGGQPPFAAGLEIVDRAGCDRAPIDASSADGRLRLLSAVWPGQERRFALLRDALEIAASAPPPLDRADAIDWLDVRLAAPVSAAATVVFHSVFAQYLDQAQQGELDEILARAGRRATDDAPFAHVALERSADFTHTELRVTLWPGGQERLLATAGFHHEPVGWLG